MKRKPLFCLGFILLLVLQDYGQDKVNIKFGNISEKDFATKIYTIDSNTNAIVLAEIGSSAIDDNTKG